MGHKYQSNQSGTHCTVCGQTEGFRDYCPGPPQPPAVPRKFFTLAEQLAHVRERFPDAELTPKPSAKSLYSPHYLTLTMPLVPGWGKPQTCIMVEIPVGFPFAPPKNFYADADLRLSHGGFPRFSDQRIVDGKKWLWVYGHVHTWSPWDTALTYVHVIKNALANMVK